MGLALHDPTGSAALPGLLPEQHRYIPDTRGPLDTARHRNLLQHQQIGRAKYVRWAERHDSHAVDDALGGTGLKLPRKLHPHQLAVLNACRQRHGGAALPASAGGRVRMRKRTTRAARSWLDDGDEGRDLARSRVSLPSDGDRSGRRRPPSLERQEAFVDAATKKSKQSSLAGEDLDVRELYRMGLLYDDEHQRGSGFSLDAIVHDEPAYTLSVRRGKRGQKRKAVEDIGEGWYRQLPLDLSFAALGDDDAVAQWLISSSYEGADDVTSVQDAWSDYQSVAGSDRPITIVYELDESPGLLTDDDGASDEDSEDWAVLQDGDTAGPNNGEAAQTNDNPDDWVMLM